MGGKNIHGMILLMSSLLTFPLAYGMSCENVQPIGSVSCTEIVKSDASDTEKAGLISSLVYGNNLNANHELVNDWNNKIIFGDAPIGVEAKSDGYIKDAWLKIVAVTPSVIKDDKLISSGKGTVLTKYNYNFEMPSEKEGGDCKTEYTLKQNNAVLDVYLNGMKIGDSESVNFEGNEGLNFESILRISTNVEAEHYKTVKYCCKKGSDGKCSRYCEKCQFSTTEERRNRVEISDRKNAFALESDPKLIFKTIDLYKNTLVANLNSSDIANFQLDFGNSYLRNYEYKYRLNLTLKPYDVFAIVAERANQTDFKNLKFERQDSNFRIYANDPKECRISYGDYFNAFEKICSLESDAPGISIRTDKLVYDEGENIEVFLAPENVLMNVKYGEQEKTGKDSVRFKAISGENRITASSQNKTFEKIIHVKRKETWSMALNFGIFSSLMYSFYSIARKYLNWF